MTLLRAVVIYPNERTDDVGDLLAIARATAQKRERTHENVKVRVLKFVPECACYVVVYEAADRKREP